MLLTQNKHKEPQTEKELFNSLMLQFVSDYSCSFVPMDLTIQGNQKNKKPLKGYGWSNLTDDKYKKDRARILKNNTDDKTQLQELNRLKWSYKAVNRTKQLNSIFELLTIAQKQGNQYYLKELNGWSRYLHNIDALSVIAGASNLIIFDCDTEGHNSGVIVSDDYQSVNTLKEWCIASGIDFNIFLNTLTVRTPSGGYHFIFRYIDRFKSVDTSIKKQIGFLKSVDLIAGHNVFIAPYSAKIYNGVEVQHYLPVKLNNQDNSFSFEYLEASTSTRLRLSVLPDELEQAIIKKQEKPMQRLQVENTPKQFYTSTERQKQKASKILAKNLNNFSLAGNGTRHDALLKNVRNVFMFYQYLSDYPKEYILDMFRDKASQLGLSSSEIETPLRDAMKFGLSNQKTLN